MAGTIPDGELLAGLVAAVGESHVLTDAGLTASYLTDWTGAYTGRAVAVVRPADVDEVARVVRVCAAAGVALCPQGGNTGLVGGSVPPSDGTRTVLLSLARLTEIGEVDVAGRTVGVGAGVTLAALQQTAAAAGLAFGVDLAARDSATVGGMIATNAGGIHLLRYGNMRAQLLGVEAVLASGEILRRWLPLRKDNVGYDLPGLLAGSEGTLAVITGALLRLVVPPVRTAVAVVAVDDVPAATALIGAVEAGGLVLQAAELMTADGVDLVVRHGARRPVPAGAPYYLLLEAAGATATDLAESLADVDGVVEAVADDGPARELWAVRERHTEAIARDGATPVVKFDVSLPAARIPAALAATAQLAAQAGGRLIPFGHLADGNLHLNVLDVAPYEVAALTDAVLREVAAAGGSISAEHGVGRSKSGWLGLGRDDVDVAAMRAIKTALDPAVLLNPGVIFE